MQKSTLTFLLFLGTMIAADNCQAFPIDEEWTPVTDIYNHSLSGFIQREELSHTALTVLNRPTFLNLYATTAMDFKQCQHSFVF